MGFKMLDSMVVDIFTTVPAIDGGWIKTGGQGTDPFFNWGCHWSPLKECLSVLRIMSSPSGVPEGWVGFYELTGILFNIDSAIEWETTVPSQWCRLAKWPWQCRWTICYKQRQNNKSFPKDVSVHTNTRSR